MAGDYTLGYDAENRLITITGNALNTRFVYAGDGKRVKATVNDVTTYFVGAFFEQTTTGIITYYYYANGQRIALKKGVPSITCSPTTSVRPALSQTPAGISSQV